MQPLFLLSLLTLSISLGACSSSSNSTSTNSTAESNGSGESWVYSLSASNGPYYWHLLTDKQGKIYSNCGPDTGTLSQSPIDIPAPADLPTATQDQANLAPLVFNYGNTDINIMHTGYRVQVNNSADTNTITFDGINFTLGQFHFHTPSEHSVAGSLFDGELHIVHQDADGNYIFIAVLYEIGPTDEPAIQTLIDLFPSKDMRFVQVQTHQPFDLNLLLPPVGQRETYRYTGSLTIPPCDENVKWFVMKTPVKLSQAQIDVFKANFEGNHRPTQQLNGRTITVYGEAN